MVQTPRPVAEYILRVRDANRNLVGEVDAYDSFGAVLRFNSVSTWTLALAASHPMAGYLATRGYGVQVLRNVRDKQAGAIIASASGVLLSGPVRSIHRRKSGNLLEVAGVSDDCWLAARDAWPVTTAPNYAAYVTTLPGLLRYYRLGEASGTTSAADAKSGQTGTYSASGVTLAQPALVDDADTAATFDGASGNVSLPTTGLPTGNGAFWLAAWVKASAFGAGGVFTNAAIFGAGSVARDSIRLGLSATGVPAFGDALGTAVSAPNAVGLGETHLLVGTWDGTTRKLYVDGALVASDTPGAYVLAYGSARLGANLGAANNFWNGTLDEVLIGAASLPTDAQIAQLYLLGRTRFAGGNAYDTQGPAACETLLRHYVDVNAGPSAVAVRQVGGLALQAVDAQQGAQGMKGNARFDQLVNAKDGTSGLLQQLAQSGGGIGFRVVQTTGGTLQFQVYTPTDRTASVIFSDALGNLADFDYEVDAPDFTSGGNVVVVGGGGQGTARTFLISSDVGSVSAWGRNETFVDARDTSDLATLQQRAADALAQMQEQTRFSATLAPQEALTYGLDFGLGDKVTVVVDGASYTDILREVDIELSRDQAETITPGVGTPGGDIIRGFLGHFATDARRAAARVARLERTQ